MATNIAISAAGRETVNSDPSVITYHGRVDQEDV
jgi:hypothetical protein